MLIKYGYSENLHNRAPSLYYGPHKFGTIFKLIVACGKYDLFVLIVLSGPLMAKAILIIVINPNSIY